MTIFHDFNRVESLKRGIDPAVSEAAWNTEGGLTEAARRGTFNTGASWWAPQLHYGGAGYEHLGTVAGMGNSFTAKTGWAPGDPRAWRDALRYALDRVKASGWQPWYGPATIGITGMRGVDPNFHWGGTPDHEWDYKTGDVVVPKVTFNANEPAHPQDKSYDCSQDSLEWALHALGRAPTDGWLESTMIAEGVMSPDQGLLDASGAGLAAFIGRHYGEFGFYGNNEPSVTFDGAAHEGDHAYPILVGGRRFGAAGHWVGVRGYSAARDTLLLANPADGYDGIRQEMTRAQWDARGPWSMVRVLHPDLLEAFSAPPVEPPPVTPPAPSRAAVLVAEIETRLAELRRLVA